MTKEELTSMVAEILSQMHGKPEPMVKASDYKTVVYNQREPERETAEDVTALDLRKLYLTEQPAQPDKFRKMKEKTPARLGSGKAGARYKTLTMLRFRADHAAAQDAVFSQVDEKFPEKNGLVSVVTRCRDKDEYLTRPDLGRCFDEENAAKIRRPKTF